MSTDPLALETAARKAADDALDTRLKAVEAKVGITPPVTQPPITQPPVTPPVAPTASGVYGSGVSGDSRANLQVGWTNHAKLDYRFRASISDKATTLRVQERGGNVYSHGNGGAIRASIQTDAAGLPSGNVLASLSWRPGNQGTTNWEVWTLHTFPTPASLIAGQLYHLVFENTDADPVANNISLNMLFTFSGAPNPAVAPDMVTLYAEPTTWKQKTGNLPIFDLGYAGGKHDGQAYIGTLWDKHGVVNGSASMVRERFTVTGGDRIVQKAHVRLKRISGSGPLIVRLEKDGAVLESISVPSSQVAVGTRPDGSAASLAGDTWVTALFAAPHTLTNGQAYALRLSTDAATTYTVVPVQQGTSKGLASRVFGDGDGQRTTDGGTSWSNLYLYDAVDLQWYLD